MSQTSSSLTRQTEDYHRSTKAVTDFSLKNKFLFECLFCKGTFKKFLSYLKHISKHEMKQIHKCTICKKIVIEDKNFREHLFEKHREFIKLSNKSEEVNQNNNNTDMDNFYHQIPYSYYQQFPQITTPILPNYMIKTEQQSPHTQQPQPQNHNAMGL